MVSVSRLAGPPHFGQVVFTNSGVAASGDPPSPVSFTFSGSITGRSLSGTATIPSFAQYTTGIGVPQYRCREMPQSFNLKIVSARPNPFCSANAAIFAIAASLSIPLYGPEFTLTPYWVNASPAIDRPDGLEFGSPSTFNFELSTSLGATTTRTGNPYFWQNSRSRWS